MDNIEKIRKFVKELQQDFISIQPKDCSLELIKSYAGYAYLDKVLSFLDTLSEEPDKSLEEVAYKYSFDSRPSIYGQVDVIDAFKAGAKWKKDALLEWAKERYKSTISNVGCYTGHSVWAEVIEKLESL